MFLALLLVVPILWFLIQEYKKYRKNGLKAFGGMAQIEGQGSSIPQKTGLFLAGIFLLAVAATNPRLKGKPITTTRKGGDIIFALDVSKSMLAQDVKPSRLERAKLLCLNLMQEFDNQRVAVVVFAGDAYVTMPFSTNYSAVSNFIDEANPSQVSAQGSDYGNLITTLIEFFGVDKLAERGVVVLSDGEDHSDLKAADVKKANDAGLVFFTVGLGKTKGVPIPDGRGYLQDRSGKKVITKLHKKSLKMLAGSRGKYFSPSEKRTLLSAIRQLRESNFSDLKSYEYNSLFQWFLFPGILLIFLPFWSRLKKAKVAMIILLIGLFGGQVFAQASHKELLKADKLFKKQKYDDASKLYGDVAQKESENTQALYNSGVAEAKADKKKEALEYFAKAAENADNQQDKASALYNAGTLLLSEKNQLDTSIKLLKEALRNSPKDTDIRKNLAKAIQLKRQQQKQQQQKQNDQKNKQNKDQQNKQNKDQQQKDNKQKNNQQKDNKQNQDKQDAQKQNQKNQKEQKKNQDQQNDPNQQKKQNQDPQKQAQDQGKDPQKSAENQPKSDTQKHLSIKKQKALQKLKMIEARERSVRKKLQKMKGKNANHSGKNW